jgi:hypothetical protein
LDSKFQLAACDSFHGYYAYFEWHFQEKEVTLFEKIKKILYNIYTKLKKRKNKTPLVQEETM